MRGYENHIKMVKMQDLSILTQRYAPGSVQGSRSCVVYRESRSAVGCTEPFEEATFTDRLFFTGPEGKDVAVGMLPADIEIAARD